MVSAQKGYTPYNSLRVHLQQTVSSIESHNLSHNPEQGTKLCPVVMGQPNMLFARGQRLYSIMTSVRATSECGPTKQVH
jgi:hypothetical protein